MKKVIFLVLLLPILLVSDKLMYTYTWMPSWAGISPMAPLSPLTPAEKTAEADLWNQSSVLRWTSRSPLYWHSDSPAFTPVPSQNEYNPTCTEAYVATVVAINTAIAQPSAPSTLTPLSDWPKGPLCSYPTGTPDPDVW